MKLKRNITLGKILCVYIDQDPNIIYSYANYSMTFELMTLSVNYEPKIEKPFLSYTPIYQDFISCSCRTAHSFPYSSIQKRPSYNEVMFPPLQMYHQRPVNPALRIMFKASLGYMSLRLSGLHRDSQSQKSKKKSVTRNLNHRTVRTFKTQAEL